VGEKLKLRVYTFLFVRQKGVGRLGGKKRMSLDSNVVVGKKYIFAQNRVIVLKNDVQVARLKVSLCNLKLD